MAQTPLRISEIQGNSSVSPYEGQMVQSDSNIVTAVFNNGFFIQSLPSRYDADSLSSEGILVYLGDDSGLSVGDLINITGVVQEYEGETEITGFQTNWQVLAQNQPLPAAVALNSQFPSDQYFPLPQLERLEGMRVEFANATICAPGDSNDPAGFYLADQRPFREAGIRAPGLPGLPVWDNNPELLFFDAGFQGGNNIRVSSGMTLTAQGVLSVEGDHYMVLPENYDLQGELVDHRAREKADQEVSIGCLNALFLDSDSSPSNMIHRQQIAIYIVDGMKGPDIVALQEVENLAAMKDVANRVQQLNPNLQYEAFLLQGNSSSINLGYLINPKTVIDWEIQQLGKSESLSIGGTMHNRPPLLLTAAFSTDPPTPIQVLNLHLKSLIGIEGSNQDFVRTKRHEAAISVAQKVQTLQTDNLVVLGDFNAFPESDGYVDVVNQITGQTSQGAERPVEAIVSPPLTNQSVGTFVDPAQQYSYVFRGNAQTLDHCLTNDMDGLEVTGLEYIRGNADNPDLLVNNPLTPQFSSDHDGFVLYLQLVDSLITVGHHSPLAQASIYYPNPFSTGQSIEFRPELSGDYDYAIWTMGGQLLESASLGFVPGGVEQRIVPQAMNQRGMYVLEISGPGVQYSGKVVVVE